MANICKNCGFEFDENENICPECNTEISAKEVIEEISEEEIIEEISEDTDIENTPADDNKASKAISTGVTVICFIMVIALALGLFYVIFIDNSNVALKKFFKGIEKEDNKTLVSSLSDYMLSDEMKNTDIAKQINDIIEGVYGGNIELDYEVTEKQEISEEGVNILNAIFETIGDGGLEIVKSYAVTVDVKIKGDNSSDTITLDLDLAKLKGEGWRVFSTPAQFLAEETWTAGNVSAE